MLKHLKNLDWWMIASSAALSVFGLVVLFALAIDTHNYLNFFKQVGFFIFGILMMLVFSIIDWRGIKDNSYLILFLYFLSVVALAGLFIFAPTTRGIKAWYKVGPITIDPIEFAKIALMLLLAKYFSSRHIEMYRLRHILLSGIYVAIPVFLIIRQPNLGSGLVLIFLWLGILVVSGIKLKHFLLLGFCGLLVVTLGWFYILKDYQKARIISFVAPQLEPLGMNWNQNQSKIAIGAGGIFGQGFNNGTQSKYGFLPETHTDFMYATFAEQYGIVGIGVLIALFLILLWRILKIAFESGSNFPRLFAFGFALVLFTQFIINISMNLGLLPVIGISLPLVSYGGSGLVSIFVCLGILQSIKAN